MHFSPSFSLLCVSLNSSAMRYMHNPILITSMQPPFNDRITFICCYIYFDFFLFEKIALMRKKSFFTPLYLWINKAKGLRKKLRFLRKGTKRIPARNDLIKSNDKYNLNMFRIKAYFLFGISFTLLYTPAAT